MCSFAAFLLLALLVVDTETFDADEGEEETVGAKILHYPDILSKQ